VYNCKMVILLTIPSRVTLVKMSFRTKLDPNPEVKVFFVDDFKKKIL